MKLNNTMNKLIVLTSILMCSSGAFAADASISTLAVDVDQAKQKSSNNSDRIASAQAGAKATAENLNTEIANRIAGDKALQNSINNISLTPGPKGDTGSVGSQGLTGDTGAVGPQGLKGDKGDQGIQGLKGDIGAVGLPGLKGDTGTVGPQGLPGFDGAMGPEGPQGIQGETGPEGPMGPPGGVDLSLVQMIMDNQEIICQMWMASPPPGQTLPDTCQLILNSNYSGVTIAVEGVTGEILVPSNCQPGEYSCQAKQVCETITGEACVHQDYDCAYGNRGSWYPQSGAGGGAFNFAYDYDFGAGGNYGNICDCDPNEATAYGLAINHLYCGVGHWSRQ